MRLTILADDGGLVTTVALRGELDLATALLLEGQVDRLIAERRNRIRVDLYELTFCDSVGLNALVRIRRRCDADGGWLRVTRPRGEVAEVLAICGLDLSGND